MTLNSKRRGFTLVELLVVVAMIGLIMGALATSVAGARERSKVQKAVTEVKSISQAIQSLENYLPNHELPVIESPQKLSGQLLQQLIGKGGASESGSQIPVILKAAMSGGGDIRDPWGHPYYVKIRKGKVSTSGGVGLMSTGFSLPNFYRLSRSERE